MNAAVIDTLDYANRLKAAGVPSGQAEAEAQALSAAFEAQSRQLQESIDARFKQSGTLADNALGRLELKIDMRFADVQKQMDARFTDVQKQMDARFAAVALRFARMDGEFLLVKWMLGLIVAGVIALVMKSFI
jgi:ElaB/YqjD/DUF883 family membrane-anchored ribosome-binding protein